MCVVVALLAMSAAVLSQELDTQGVQPPVFRMPQTSAGPDGAVGTRTSYVAVLPAGELPTGSVLPLASLSSLPTLPTQTSGMPISAHAKPGPAIIVEGPADRALGFARENLPEIIGVMGLALGVGWYYLRVAPARAV